MTPQLRSILLATITAALAGVPAILAEKPLAEYAAQVAQAERLVVTPPATAVVAEGAAAEVPQVSYHADPARAVAHHDGVALTGCHVERPACTTVVRHCGCRRCTRLGVWRPYEANWWSRGPIRRGLAWFFVRRHRCR